MREFKFRAWDEDSKRMITHEQDFIPLKICSLGVLRLDPTSEQSRWELLKGSRFKLMQWIGTSDKNGIDVYEDDILQDNNSKTYKIVWGHDLLWLAITTDKSCCTYCPKGISKKSVIIGNMKENPERWR